MATYRAVVKVPTDATPDESRKLLKQGLEDIAMELVGEHGLGLTQIEDALENAQGAAEQEADARALREQEEENS